MLLILLACTAPASESSGQDSTAVGLVDLRMDFEDPPEGGTQFLTPDLTVPPYSERIFCYYGRWDGDDVGVNYMAPLSAAGVTHHNQLKAVDEDDTRFAPGSLALCPDIDSLMPVYAPLFESVGYPSDGGAPPQVDPSVAENWLNFPEGVAFKLRHGQRWVMDVHYVNTTPNSLLVNAAVNLGIVPVPDVKAWAGAIQFDTGDLNILPHQDTTAQFTCAWKSDYTVLSLMGHMHDHGSSYQIQWNHLDGTSEILYDVDPWSPAYREYPRVNAYADGTLAVHTGDTFTTTCTWHNDTDEVLAYPLEMCTTVGVIYPSEEPISCFGGVED